VAEGTARGLQLASGAAWVTASYEVMKMKAINHKHMIRLEGTIAFKAVRMSVLNSRFLFSNYKN
jgi:hypothetical protein